MFHMRSQNDMTVGDGALICCVCFAQRSAAVKCVSELKALLSVLLLAPLRMHAAGLALEELLVTAQRQGCLTVGLYESAKHLNE